MREREVEAYLVKSVEEIGGVAFKFSSPARRGVPDRICVFPTGAVVFVETKAPGGRLTRLQDRELRRLRELGQSTAVVSSKAGVDFLLKEVLS